MHGGHRTDRVPGDSGGCCASDARSHPERIHFIAEMCSECTTPGRERHGPQHEASSGPQRDSSGTGWRPSRPAYNPGVPIYLDHAATTPLRPEALEAMLPYLGGEFGNPSSPHGFGRRARAALDEAHELLSAKD